MYFPWREVGREEGEREGGREGGRKGGREGEREGGREEEKRECESGRRKIEECRCKQEGSERIQHDKEYY